MSRFSCSCVGVFGVCVAAAMGCSSAPVEGSPSESARVESEMEAPPSINPCDPAWQLPTWMRGNLSSDPAFIAFENRLQKGDALWVGSFALQPRYRAVVRVDVVASSNKKLIDTHAWYLADIPIDSADALLAVDDYSGTYPVDSRMLGYCLSDGTFIQKGYPVPPTLKIRYAVTEYDPRCVCDVPQDGVVTTYR